MELFLKTVIFLKDWVWQLPQNLLGVIMVFLYQAKLETFFHGKRVYISKEMKGGVSLGKYIIIKSYKEEVIKHEYGHSLQSEYTGWLYLLIFGIPSAIHNLYHRNKCKDVNYYHFYTEKWANYFAVKKLLECE